MLAWIYLLIAIVCEVIATAALNASAAFTKLVPSAISIVGYGISFYLLSLSLRTLPLGIAYAIWAGMGLVLISVIGWLWFKQNLDTVTIIGMGLIISGVTIIHLFSSNLPHSH